MIIIVHTDTSEEAPPHRVVFLGRAPHHARCAARGARPCAGSYSVCVSISGPGPCRGVSRVIVGVASARRVSGSLASPLRRSLSTVSRVEPPPYQLATQHAVRFRSAQCTAHLISTPTYFLCTLTDCPTEDSPLVRAALPGFATPWLRCACSGSSPSLSCAPFHAAPPAL